MRAAPASEGGCEGAASRHTLKTSKRSTLVGPQCGLAPVMMTPPQVVTSNPHHSGLARADPAEGAGLAIFILGPFSPSGAGRGIERGCPPSAVSISLSPRKARCI